MPGKDAVVKMKFLLGPEASIRGVILVRLIGLAQAEATAVGGVPAYRFSDVGGSLELLQG